MKIFKTYTGNAMLNNALMTLEALGEFNSVDEIEATDLLRLFSEVKLISLTRRLKNYTMLFTNNGVLYNDKKNGEKIYKELFTSITNNFENEGDRVCELSGLNFSKSFEQFYIEVLKKIGLTDKEIQSKDTTINRTWYPLIGSLGSDAQALPQAKFAVEIHPICLIIIQFLPLSALLYKGGILLVDSSNFKLSREFVIDNQKELWKRIKATASDESVENIRDFSKGNYVLKAIEILKNKEAYEEAYSDLNFWSFSNSGTGASCSIDRIPNSLIRKLIRLNKNPLIGAELKSILNNISLANGFLSDFEANKEWYLLYPNVFGSGKKRVDYEGVSVDFLEVYLEETGSNKQKDYAKYIAGLVFKYKTESFEKILEKVDAWNESTYRIELFSVLLEATENGKWRMEHQIQILDREGLPIKNYYYQLHKLVHFYYQKKHFSDQLPELKSDPSLVYTVCLWMIGIIQQDERNTRIIEELKDRNKYKDVGYTQLFIRVAERLDVRLVDVLNVLYDTDFRLSKYGLNELLRLFFTQKYVPVLQFDTISISDSLGIEEQCLTMIKNFAVDYQKYYYDKYRNRETEALPIEKFKNLVKGISLNTYHYMVWLREAVANTNSFLKKEENQKGNKWKEEDLLYTPNGELSISFVKLAVVFTLVKQSNKQLEKELLKLLK